MHGFGWQGLIKFLHNSPVKPEPQEHVKLPTVLTQAPLRHGLFKHSSLSNSHKVPVKPGRQSQVLVVGFNSVFEYCPQSSVQLSLI